ncbi:MAG: hypothetical protein H6747_14145 [Deltaproteobacteria bacterium]|nr:hypothetical protein [Deltaproteobacteria bacterium]
MNSPTPPPVQRQPDDTTCGPTCLQAVYAHWALHRGDEAPSLDEVIATVHALPQGGTLAVHLGNDALQRGYRATIFTYNLQLFDPTWFEPGVDLRAKLRAQRAAKDDEKLAAATDAYLRFLAGGGEIRCEDLDPALLHRLLDNGAPILTGLSATWLYRCARERGEHVVVHDDVAGQSAGHFVVLYGVDADRAEVLVADPLHDNPGWGSGRYVAPLHRVIPAILLGVVTYDANLLVIEPADAAAASPPRAPS